MGSNNNSAIYTGLMLYNYYINYPFHCTTYT